MIIQEFPGSKLCLRNIPNSERQPLIAVKRDNIQHEDQNWNLNKPLDIRLIQPNIVEIAVSRIACNISALIYRKQGIFTLC